MNELDEAVKMYLCLKNKKKKEKSRKDKASDKHITR